MTVCSTVDAGMIAFTHAFTAIEPESTVESGNRFRLRSIHRSHAAWVGLTEDEIDVLYGELREQKQRDEALLRQALEGLEGVAQWVEKRPDTHPWDAWQRVEPAITAIKERLK